MRGNTSHGPRGPGTCFSCVSITLVALGWWFPWKDNANTTNTVSGMSNVDAEPIVDTEVSGATNTRAMVLSDAGSVRGVRVTDSDTPSGIFGGYGFTPADLAVDPTLLYIFIIY